MLKEGLHARRPCDYLCKPLMEALVCRKNDDGRFRYKISVQHLCEIISLCKIRACKVSRKDLWTTDHYTIPCGLAKRSSETKLENEIGTLSKKPLSCHMQRQHFRRYVSRMCLDTVGGCLAQRISRLDKTSSDDLAITLLGFPAALCPHNGFRWCWSQNRNKLHAFPPLPRQLAMLPSKQDYPCRSNQSLSMRPSPRQTRLNFPISIYFLSLEGLITTLPAKQPRLQATLLAIISSFDDAATLLKVIGHAAAWVVRCSDMLKYMNTDTLKYILEAAVVFSEIGNWCFRQLLPVFQISKVSAICCAGQL